MQESAFPPSFARAAERVEAELMELLLVSQRTVVTQCVTRGMSKRSKTRKIYSHIISYL